MPVEYEIISDAMQARVVGTGAVSMAAMITIFDRIAADPLFHSHYTTLVDLRTARYTAELADGDALTAVLRQKKTDFQNKLALVVPESLHLLARLYCSLVTLGGFDKIHCFTDIEKAEEWLKIPLSRTDTETVNAPVVATHAPPRELADQTLE